MNIAMHAEDSKPAAFAHFADEFPAVMECRQGRAYLAPVLLFVFLSRVKLEARASIPTAVGPSLAPLHLVGMLLGHGQQVLRDGGFGLLQRLHQVTRILILFRPDECDSCALVASAPCTTQEACITYLAASNSWTGQ